MINPQSKETVRIYLPKKEYEPWIRGKSKDGIEESLKKDFADTLDNPKSPVGGGPNRSC